ncbi:DUF5615 family PIN-like protein [Natrinema salsiterrestre]|uniref:DUF5615 family PIN-like protein n=1 Tax=Natrinema salsiterrestre TaxID=2950540 RepID=UPI0031F2DAF5
MLRGKGHDAVHVHDVLEEGATDERIVAHADTNGYLVLTHDDDFLRPEYRREIRILYYSSDSIDSYEIADRVDRVTRYVPDPIDLPRVTNIGEWS